MSPSREQPVAVLYPNGKTVTFQRQPWTGYWLGLDERGVCVVERDRLADAIEAAGRTSGCRARV